MADLGAVAILIDPKIHLTGGGNYTISGSVTKGGVGKVYDIKAISLVKNAPISAELQTDEDGTFLLTRMTDIPKALVALGFNKGINDFDSAVMYDQVSNLPWEPATELGFGTAPSEVYVIGNEITNEGYTGGESVLSVHSHTHGLYYFEVEVLSGGGLIIGLNTQTTDNPGETKGFGWYSTGDIQVGGVSVGTAESFTAGDTVQVFLKNRSVWLNKVKDDYYSPLSGVGDYKTPTVTIEDDDYNIAIGWFELVSKIKVNTLAKTKTQPAGQFLPWDSQ